MNTQPSRIASMLQDRSGETLHLLLLPDNRRKSTRHNRLGILTRQTTHHQYPRLVLIRNSSRRQRLTNRRALNRIRNAKPFCPSLR
jgi:hypothetical protein